MSSLSLLLLISVPPAVLMVVLSFALEPCFKGGLTGRVFGGLLTAAALGASLFFLTVLLQSGIQFLLLVLTRRSQASQPIDFLLSLGGALTAGIVAAAVTFLFFGRSLGCAFVTEPRV